MSRAFVKELDNASPEPRIDTTRSQPNYMTKAGLGALRKRLAEATGEQERKRLERSVQTAIVVAPVKHSQTVEFGSTVSVLGAGEGEQSFTIVGEDEADFERGKIPFTSPLADALLHKRVGQKTVWKRPKGNRALTITAIS